MRNSMPLQWIEQVEATRALDAARFEWTPQPTWFAEIGREVAGWLSQLRDRLAESVPVGWPALQAQPIPVPHSADRRRLVRRSADRDGFGLY